MHRRLAAVTAAVVVFGLSGAAAAPKNGGFACKDPAKVKDVGGGWEAIDVPSLTPNPLALGQEGHVSHMHVDAVDPNTIAVTDSRVVLLTTDGGCSWRKVFDKDSNLAGEKSAVAVKSIEMTHASDGRRRVLLHLESLATQAESIVAVTTDDGATWEFTEFSDPTRRNNAYGFGIDQGNLVVAPSNPDVLYLALGGSSPMKRYLYSSQDAGATWQLTYTSDLNRRLADDQELQRRDPPDASFNIRWGPAAGSSVNDALVVSPIDPKELWLMDGHYVFHSKDGGLTFSIDAVMQASSPQGYRGVVAGASSSSDRGPMVALQYAQDPGTDEGLVTSGDGGSSWTFVPLDFGPVGDIEISPRSGDVYISARPQDGDGSEPAHILRRESRSGGWIEILSPTTTFYFDMHMARQGRFTVLYAREGVFASGQPRVIYRRVVT